MCSCRVIASLWYFLCSNLNSWFISPFRCGYERINLCLSSRLFLWVYLCPRQFDKCSLMLIKLDIKHLEWLVMCKHPIWLYVSIGRWQMSCTWNRWARKSSPWFGIKSLDSWLSPVVQGLEWRSGVVQYVGHLVEPCWKLCHRHGLLVYALEYEGPSKSWRYGCVPVNGFVL